MVENKNNTSERERLINEEIDAREKIESKGNKIARIVGIVLCLAVMFGIIAGIFYAISTRVIEYVNEKDAEGSRTHVGIVDNNPEITKIPENTTIVDVSELAEKIEDSVFTVQVQTEKNDGIFSNPVKSYKNISGVLVADDGKNFYLLSDDVETADAKKIYLVVNEDTVLECKRLGAAEALGLSVLIARYDEVLTDEGKGNIIPLKFASGETIKIGKPCLAIGAPNGIQKSIDFGYVTSGDNYVSVADIRVEVMTSNMNYYKDGRGLVVDSNAEICGIILKQNKAEAVFAFISTAEILDELEKLINEGNLPYAGIICEELSEEEKKSYDVEKGVYVAGVSADAPAEAAGVRTGDIITSVEDVVIDSVKEYTNALFSHKIGEKVNITLVRDGSEQTVTIEIK